MIEKDWAQPFIRALRSDNMEDCIREFYHPEMIHIEYASLLRPRMSINTLQAISKVKQVGKELLINQRSRLIDVHITESCVIAEFEWRGVLTIDTHDIAAGTRLRAFIAQMFKFRNGKVIRQKSYDCIEVI